MSLPSSSSGSNEKQQVDDEDDDDDEEFYDTDPLPIIGRCRAMYPFEGMFFGCGLFCLCVFMNVCQLQSILEVTTTI